MSAMQMRAGFSCGGGAFDELIRRVQPHGPTLGLPPLPADWEPPTHGWWEWRLDDGPWWGIEAVVPYVHEFAATEKQGQVVRYYDLAVSDAQARAAYTAALGDIGHRYDYLGIAVVGLYDLLRVPALFWRGPGGSVYCIELMTRIARAADVPFLRPLAPTDTTPLLAEQWCRHPAA